MLTHTLGFPRMGRARELKTALEAFWAGTSSRAALLETARSLRLRHWTAQVQAGVDIVPVGDFSLYDHMLDMTVRLGVAPQRFRLDGQPPMPDGLDAFFRMARGGEGVAALEMTKWFDTNYHYLVPELERGQVFRPDASGLLEQLAEAHDAGLRAKVVLPGPCTFLHLAKSVGPDFDRFELLPELTQAYVELVQALADPKRGAAEWIQLDEPVLALDLPRPCPGASARPSKPWPGRPGRPGSCSPPASAPWPRMWMWFPALSWTPCTWTWCARRSSWTACSPTSPPEPACPLAWWTAATCGGWTRARPWPCSPARWSAWVWSASWSRLRVRCCIVPWTWATRPCSTRSCGAGWPSPCRSARSCADWRIAPPAGTQRQGVLRGLAGRERTGPGRARGKSAPARPGGAAAHGRGHAGDALPRPAVSRAGRAPETTAGPAASAHHHHRLLPANQGTAPGARQIQARRASPPGL